MLGSLRLFLALSVVIAHLTDDVRFFSHWGVFAVFGFYLISGYLITTILHETYSFRFSAFAINRFLRLFPIYYILAIATAFIINLSSGASAFHPAWSVQTRWQDIFGNIFIIPFEFYDSSFRLVPPTWSVAVELVNYFLLWLIVARNRSLAALTFLIAATYHIASFMSGADWGRRYYPAYAALLPFSMGALIYFFRNTTFNPISRSGSFVTAISCAAWLMNLALCGLTGGAGSEFFNFFFYTNLGLFAVFLFATATLPGKNLKFKWDKELGDLAYPVFLTHWIVGYVMSKYFLEGQQRGMALFIASLIPIIL
ncbi:MAG: acyltransferase, partial [Niabella sp.]|nr:acyltransferase [Niabella sp.]